ncbi:MAG TPA: TonB-dependent receptor [Vicinamibacterales bacterium]|nr:TonB-dependent receptor [Vicinamibacterales bacterium]
MRRALVVWIVVCAMATPGAQDARTGIVSVEVRSENGLLSGAIVVAGRASGVTDNAGHVSLSLPEGSTRISARLTGYLEETTEVVVEAGREQRVVITLAPSPQLEEEVVVVATTRTGRRLEEQPTRVEVLGREEIEEKMLMTPGDIVMMLNEMGGLRVQATSPSIGAAAVRVQGMKGRYTRFFSDGLPLFGQQAGGLGLLQIPPMDLGQVEVIKGVASSLYGAGAMGGVVNLLSRRPAARALQEFLFNQSSLGATDGVVFLASPARQGWSASLLGGGHRQSQVDRDDDQWADLAAYVRGVVRPRVFWDGGNGRSAFLTAGATVENRDGGTMDDGVLAATGAPYIESLDTRRYDMGGTVQTLIHEQYVLTARGAAAWQRHDHRFGNVRERDAHDTLFSELALRGAAGAHTWVTGLAYERDDYQPRDVPRFAYTYNTGGVFAQDDIDLRPWMSVSLGARLDVHDEYGTFFSPRVAALFRAGEWTSRVSAGQGFFASTPLTEETEAAGLSRLTMIGSLEAERGASTSVDLTRRIGRVSLTGTFFASRVRDALGTEREEAYALFTRPEPSTNIGAEVLATMRAGRYSATGTYAYVRSRETGFGGRQDAPLTPRHSAGLVGMWEAENAGRVGLEAYYTGPQRLEANPYRSQSRGYISFGFLAERKFGPVRLFINAENLTDARQTRWDSLVRPAPGADGRWTVDAWAPLDGRVFNGGLRLGFD